MGVKDIVVLGAGGFAREVAFLIEEINRVTPTWNILGFVESEGKELGRQVGKYEVVYTEPDLTRIKIAAAMGIGDPTTVRKISSRFQGCPDIEFPNLTHPSTVMDQDRISMGRGNVICAGNVLTTDIQIGSFNIVNITCTVGHDTRIGDCNVINPGVTISGGVEIGHHCMIGTGSTILQYKSIGDGATVGAGAVVVDDVSPGTVVVGVPARPIERKPRPEPGAEIRAG